MIFSDLTTLKRVFDIDPLNTAEDWKLLRWAGIATNWIEEVCNRSFEYKTRTEYYRGTGTQKLLLKARPVFPAPPAPYTAITVVFDQFGYYGAGSGAFGTNATTYTYGTDYTLRIDQEDGSSRSGELIRIDSYWERPSIRQAGLLTPFLQSDTGSYKITYTAGYTQDTLPDPIRLACELLVAKLRFIMPLGMEQASDSYLDRGVSVALSQREMLLRLVKPLILPYRNWSWGSN